MHLIHLLTRRAEMHAGPLALPPPLPFHPLPSSPLTPGAVAGRALQHPQPAHQALHLNGGRK